MNALSWILLVGVMLLVCTAIRFLYRNQGAGCTGNCMKCRGHQNCTK